MSILIETLLKEGLISKEQLHDAKAKHLGAKKPLQELLVEMGFIKEEDLIKVSAKVFNMPLLDLDKETIDSAAIGLISYEQAKRYGVFPLRKEQDSIVLAMSDPQDMITLDDIGLITKLKIKPVLCTESEINKRIEKYYQIDDSLYDILKNVAEEAKIEVIKEEGEGETRLDTQSVKEGGAPIVRLFNLILSDAVKARASDIHIEPQEKAGNVRYRIDGDLRNIMEVPLKLSPVLTARIKVLAELDISETRKPQDGRIKIFFNNRKIDLRISIIPTFYGEKISIRILDPQAAKIDLERVGFEENELNVYKETITSPQGIILITGPTGSGKTSTLYAALNFIKDEKKNIMTIEDPVEYLIEGVNHMQVNPVKDVTFANGLRSILRQDPNVILVGEIRDRETADIALQASLTGHLVFSSLHTNNAVASIARLLDLGLEPYTIASSVILIVAQRLVKVICPDCKGEHMPDKQLLENFKKYIDGLKIGKFYRGKGCEKCGFSGFLGRTAIFEILRVNENIRSLITGKATEDEIFNAARNSGLKPLVSAGMEKVAQGITTLEEISQVVGIREEEKIIQKSSQTGKNLKVLIADDDEDILRVLEKRLTGVGYDVVKARDGKEAVEYAHKEKPDLTIIDVTMPKMNGFEATKKLRSKLETAVIPIILLTGRQDKESELKGFDAGADDYITKPFDADKLLARIKMLLRRRER
jgi:type IV pilus assembly protein PilB